MPSSHKGALLGRYVGPARKVFFGNSELCSAYIPLGRVLLGYLKNTLGTSGIEVGAQHLQLPNGARISALVDGVNHIIRVDVREVIEGERLLTVFVESGWINLVNLSDDPNVLLTNYLHYDSRQQAALANPFPKWMDEIIIVLNEKDVVTGLREGEVRPSDGKIRSISYQTFQYEDAEGHTQYNTTRTRVYPHTGLATGRFKLYLQAIQGSVKNKRFLLDSPTASDPWSNTVRETVTDLMGARWADTNVYLGFAWDFSHGIYVTDDYRYWLLTISGLSLIARPIKLSIPCALLRQSYRNVLDDPAVSFLEKSKIETYILSQSVLFGDPIVIDDDILARFLTDGDTVTGDGSVGDTVHEGWKFNYKGNAAQIVMDEVVRRLNPGNGVMTISYHVFRRYKLTFTHQPNNEEMPFSVGLSLVEEVQATPNDKCLRPFKFPESVIWNGVQVLEWQDWHEIRIGASRGYYQGTEEFDAPVYCFYTMDDNGAESFVTIRNIVKLPDGEVSVIQQYLDFFAGVDSHKFYVCGADKEKREQDVLFLDKLNSYHGYYVRVEEGDGATVLDELKQKQEWAEHCVLVRDARIKTITDWEHTYTAMRDFGGFINLQIYNGMEICDGGEIGSFVLPPLTSVGGDAGRWQKNGSWETYRHMLGGYGNTQPATITYGHTLVFPYNDGSSVYIQRDKTLVGAGWMLHGMQQSLNLEFSVWMYLDPSIYGEGVSIFRCIGANASFPMKYPDFADPEHIIPWEQEELSGYNSGYNGQWVEVEAQVKFYYVSAHQSGLMFDETATWKQEQTFDDFEGVKFYPEIGIDPWVGHVFGKHEWYVVLDALDYFPWFVIPTHLLESANGDAYTLQQWGEFNNGVPMIHAPIYDVTDNELPLFNGTDRVEDKTMNAVFVGWA